MMVQIGEQAALANLLSMLRAATTRLAAAPAAQIAYLDGLGTQGSADEIALEFDDAFGAMEQLVAAGVLTSEAAEALQKVDRSLADLSAMQDIWTFDALRTREEWRDVARLAGRALALLPA